MTRAAADRLPMLASVRVLTVGNMYPPHHLGGYELVWSSAVARLRAAGHDVAVLTTTHRRDGVAEGQESGVRRELRWWWRDGRWPRQSPVDRLGVERHNARVFDAAVAELEPDVVAWWSMGGMSLSLIERARRAGLPAVGFVHDDWLVYGPHVDAWLRMWRRVGPAKARAVAERATGVPVRVDLSDAALWAFVSEHTRSRALRDLSLARTTVLSSGIDPLFLEARDPPPWRWRLLYAGRVEARKGIDTAVAALEHLPPEAELIVAGAAESSWRDGIPRRVTWLGPLGPHALREQYAQADAVLFPVSWHEPWGLVPLEAMGMGRPVVATAQGGSAEYLRAGDNCLICPPGDAVALAAAVRDLAVSPELRSRLARGGAQTASRHTAPAFEREAERLLLEAR